MKRTNAMKMKPEHLEHLRVAIAPLDTEERQQQYREGRFPRAACCTDLLQRYRWDLVYAAGLSSWISYNLYPYLNDAHIDTALRRIVDFK